MSGTEPSSLTRLELEIVTLVARGLSAKEIARSVNKTPRTVEWHIIQCRQKLNAKNSAQLVANAASAAALLSSEMSNPGEC